MSNLNRSIRSVEDAMTREYPPAVPQCCSDCPWRRNSVAGWLGPYDAEKWLQIAHGESAVACHKTIPVRGGWGKNTKQCRGMGIFRRNVLKRPRNESITVGPENHEVVFSTDQEFLNHHAKGQT